ncbi:peptidoglycan DD-metalloendopeptidase family protein [Caenimonas koreensis DSM 17982]|uniref:Peptidoglycan DD-metalloendopeptidase family protein n=1 Tax=Caenimonas koreensis DSM 17982 TaxID=1121255 RepID=A0A844B351_9BURK|nr:peptidoglycan DD-metalloendopeptidase family protein [Caenimonas koreensis]MRD45977.1 peptidoglycan DD-metalloendopeptidase family protein [Caenimonas koreensis DSM 17982]
MLELRATWMTAVALAVSVLAGCASSSRAPAPVEDRSSSMRAPSSAVVPVEVPRAGLPGSENAGKPGYYTVHAGDTLIRIALETGQNWRDIARWNNIENPNVIEVGQVLRVVPPVAATTDSGVATSRPVVTGSAVPLASAPASAASAPRPASSGSVVASVPPVASAAPTPAATAGDDEVPWAWPTAAGTSVIAGFDEQRNKGLDITGKPGDAVLASADGKVVYAGAGLRGYGNLIILKHNNTYLSAYAHNQALLVKEDQSVRKGQKIAEMGSSDADRVKLHFEIRRQGKPVDPAKYLPAR